MSGTPRVAFEPEFSGVDPLTGARAAPTVSAAPNDPGDVLDEGARWERRGEIGVGGMGLVTIVFDRKLGRELAVKTPASAEDAHRLQREALITARLEHPGIIAVYDTGFGPSGAPWYSMRLVRGRSLAAMLGEARTDRDERLRLVRHVLAAAQAVAYAHARGVVHRDLKPANIMIGAFGETQVIDWGLALAPDVPSPDAGRAGTPSSMSPEQARGEVVDARADVFALGVVLREVVTGRRLFDSASAREATLAALAEERIPPLPSDEVAPELAAIIARAMAPRASARYADAKAFADDLLRYLDGRRVAAHRYTRRELLERTVRAWRVPLIVAGVGLAILTIVLAVSVATVSEARDLAEERLAHTLVTEARQALFDDDRGRAEILAREAMARAPVTARGVLMALPVERAVRAAMGTIDCAVEDLVADGPHAIALCRDPAGIALSRDAVEQWGLAVASESAVLIDHGRTVVLFDGWRYEFLAAADGRPLGAVAAACPMNRLEPSADRASALAFGGGCAARVRSEGSEVIPIDGCRGSRIRAAALSADGHAWALACADGALAVGRFGEGDGERVEAGFPVSPDALLPTALAFERADALLVGNDGGQLVRLRLTTDNVRGERREVLALGRGLVRDIVVAADGEQAVVVLDGEAPRVVDLLRWGSLGRITGARRGPRPRVAFDAEGRVLVAAGALERWDYREVPIGEVVFPLGISALSGSPEGRHLAVGWGNRLEVLDVERRVLVASHAWQNDYVKAAAMGAGSALIGAALGAPGTVRFSPLVEQPPFELRGLVKRLAWLADGSALAVDYNSKVVHLAEARAGRMLAEPEAADLATSPGGRWAALIGSDRVVYAAHDVHLGGAFGRVADEHAAVDVAVDDAGVVRVASPEVVRQWRRDGEGWVEGPALRVAGADFIAVAAAGGLVAAGSKDGAVRVWRDGESAPWALLMAHDKRADTLVIEPRGRWIAAGAWDGRVHLLHLDPTLETRSRGDAEAWWGVELGQLIGER